MTDADLDVALVVTHGNEATWMELILKPEHPLAAGEEVARVLEDVEADQVGVEHAADELFTHRDRAEDLGRGERGVEKEPDARGAQLA